MRYDSVTAVQSAPEGDYDPGSREEHITRRSAPPNERGAARRDGRVRRKRRRARGLESPSTVTEAAPTERKPLFKLPNIREDLRLLPSIFREKRIVYLPLVLLLVGLADIRALRAGQLSPEISTFAYYYIQFFFAPPALFTFFLAGFFVPRGAYLVGFIYGLIAGVIWSVGFVLAGPVAVTDGGSTPTAAPPDMVAVVATSFLYGVLYGTLAAALAAWYRDFLRGMQERGKQRRADKEVDERASGREERQEARQVAKQRSPRAPQATC